MRKRMISTIAIIPVVAGVTILLLAQPQTVPVLNQGYVGDRTVSGRAAPDSGPLRIYDLSYSTRTSIEDGKTSMDSAGNFAISVKPSLIKGHQIIAEDKYGRSSAPMTVKDSDPAARPSR